MIRSQNMAKSEEADNYSDTASKAALLEKAKNEFNREKRLIIKNLPSNTTEKDIRAFMGFNGEFPVELVDMVKNCNQAIVTLKDPSLVDDAISKLDCTKLDTLTVSVSVYRSEKVLCIAQIPQSMTEYRFRELVLEHGNIDMCFLMRSEFTGESKGYGFVEYNEPIEKVGQIKCALDWSNVDDQTVHCDAIVESSQLGITFEELHSKCLIIDNLPKDYSDSIALREEFSVLVKPVYCQIVTKESESLGFGIVEFDEAEDAETAFTEFKQHKINGVPMNIAYCIPGKSAVHMFNRIMFKYGDSVHVNRSSLLPDPIYPNPAFLKHMFFKMHVAKHPKLLVQFTDNLLHLQDGYVKRLEDKTNAKPGILGPAPTIPMSPLMDINLQLGLLSLVVLDMREKGTYNGEVPEPLGKVKIPTDEEFQEIAQPVSLLGDPMTAQANVILRNLLMPKDKPQFQKLPSTDQCNPQLLSKSVHELNMVYLCSLGRLMAMLSEKTQSMGILGNAPNIMASKPSSRPPKPLMEGVSPKPLMEGLMQVGKVAQTLLNSMGISQQNQLSQLNRNQQKGLLGNPPIMNMNTTKAASNFMNTIQQCNGGKQDFNSLFGSNNGSSGNMNKSGILGNYQGHGRMNIQSQNKHQSKKQLSGRYESEKAPQSLLALNFNNKGDGLIPTPLMDDDSSHGMQVSGYDDSGYQGGFEDGDCNEGYADAQSNFVDRGNNTANQMGTKQAARSLLDPELDVTGSSNRFDGVYFSGINARQKTGTGMNMMSEKRDGGYYNDIAQQAALYAAGAAAAYKHQYDEWVQSGYNQSQENDGNIDSGYPTNYSSDQSNYGQDGMSSRNQQWGSYMGSYSGNGGPPSLLGSFVGSGGQPSSMGSYSGNGGQSSSKGSYSGNGGQSCSKGSYSGNAGPPSLLGSFDGSGGQPSSMDSYSGNGGPPSLLGSFDGSGGQPSSMGSYSCNEGLPSLLGSYTKDGNMKSGSSSLNVRERNSRSESSGYAGSYGRDGPRSLMGPPSIRPLQGTATLGSGVSQSSLANTPLCPKRSFSHVLPSPEPSPEGEYIGQHSQGLGGHYADTYTKRQKLSGRF